MQNNVIRCLLMALIVAYILGFVPTPYCELCANPIVQLLALYGIVQLSYSDLPMALLLTVAFLIYINVGSYLATVQSWLGMQRTDLYGTRNWNDESDGTEPTGYNVDRYCGSNWAFQCQGVNTFGRGFDTQGMNEIRGFGKSRDYNAADF